MRRRWLALVIIAWSWRWMKRRERIFLWNRLLVSTLNMFLEVDGFYFSVPFILHSI
jgi:hypothetical protein